MLQTTRVAQTAVVPATSLLSRTVAHPVLNTSQILLVWCLCTAQACDFYTSVAELLDTMHMHRGMVSGLSLLRLRALLYVAFKAAFTLDLLLQNYTDEAMADEEAPAEEAPGKTEDKDDDKEKDEDEE